MAESSLVLDLSVSDDRGKRRLISSLRKKITELETAYEEAVASGSKTDYDLAKDLRDILISECAEIRKFIPEPSDPYYARREELLRMATLAIERSSSFPSGCQSGECVQGSHSRVSPPVNSTPSRVGNEGAGGDNNFTAPFAPDQSPIRAASTGSRPVSRVPTREDLLDHRGPHTSQSRNNSINMGRDRSPLPLNATRAPSNASMGSNHSGRSMHQTNSHIRV